MSARTLLAIAVCLIAWISGCNRKNCPGCVAPDPLAVGCPYAASELESAFALGTLNNPTVLILSGGGSHGAWGAGVIAGWGDGPGTPPPRPDFTIVTGISTGALQATFAFLGTAYDDKLEHFFADSDNNAIYAWKLDFLWSNGLQSRQPLRNILENQLTDTLLVAVANQTDRELMVGTVNLDTSQFCPWNLSTIARKYRDATDPTKKQCFRNLYLDAVWAASGAPVITPPVEIDSNACTGLPAQKMLHVDGGVRLRVFVTKVIDLAIATGSKPTAYVIMNGKLATNPTCTDDQLLPIALRTFEITDRENLYGSLYALMHERENLWDLKLSRIPDDQCVSLPSAEFDPPRLKYMFDAGSQWVQHQPELWETTIPEQSVAPWPNAWRRPLPCATPQDILKPPCPM